MKTYAPLLIAALALLPVSGALATPSTLVWIPSTDIQANRTWHLGIDNYFTASQSKQATVLDLGPEYGFARGRAEAGIDYVSPNSSPLFFNVKYQLTPEAHGGPAVAVGLENWGTDQGVTTYNMAYLLGSKTFVPAARLTLGYCHGSETALGRDPDMLLAGVDGTLDKAKKWWYGIDYQSGKNAFGAHNVGLSYAFAPNTSVIFGYDWMQASGLKNTLTTQLDINF
jgi:predicted porin